VLTLYLCFLAGGAVLPFISAISGFFGDGLDTDVNSDLDADADIDIDTDLDAAADIGGGEMDPDIDSIFSIGFVPTSLMSISALAITFGAVGGIMTFFEKEKIITLFAAALSGYIASVFIQTIVKSLKKLQRRSCSLNENEILMYDGKVVDTILPGQLGTVRFTTLKGMAVSYPARCTDEKRRLETGKIVKANEIKQGVVIVEPKNKYE
jgi:hypothetical protein